RLRPLAAAVCPSARLRTGLSNRRIEHKIQPIGVVLRVAAAGLRAHTEPVAPRGEDSGAYERTLLQPSQRISDANVFDTSAEEERLRHIVGAHAGRLR